MKFVSIVLFSLFLISIFLLIWNLTEWKSDGVQCLQNPLTYGAGLMKQANNNIEFLCYCNFEEQGYAEIMFDSINLQIKENRIYRKVVNTSWMTEIINRSKELVKG